MRKEKTAAILYTDSLLAFSLLKELLIIIEVKAIPFVMTLIPLSFYILHYYCLLHCRNYLFAI